MTAPIQEETDLVARLPVERKVRLLTGRDAWVLHGEEALGLRPMVTSDGPAGVRGTGFDRDNPSTSLPCPVALAATWDERLVHDLCLGLGREARSKGVDVLLGPTVNIIRTPLSGRGFECFSEDPLLTARIAVAYVRGVQAAGVGATAKHFVANDSETDRRSYDARISEGVLREVYLPPFEACVVEAEVALVMAAYNAVNGASMTANRGLLRDLLKTEWEFAGVVVSDWQAARTTVPSALAGLDLVMPGPHGPWGRLLVEAVAKGLVPEAELDDKVRRLLTLARRVGALNGHVGSPAAAPVRVAHIDPVLVRDATARSFVLLNNPRGLLPLSNRVRRVALIGPNAVEPTTQGGGSVRVLPVEGRPVAEAVAEALGEGATVSLARGCVISPTVALPEPDSVVDPVTGQAGARLEVRDAEGGAIYEGALPSSVVTWWDGLPEAAMQPGVEFVMRVRYRAARAGAHLLGVAGVGRLSLAVDGEVLAEATTVPPRDVVEAFSRPPELRARARLAAGQEVEIRAELRPDVRDGTARFATMRLGATPDAGDEELMAAAVREAAAAEVAVVVVGSADGTESEGYDRETLALPGRQDELVRRVAAANPNTIVVVNSGMPVLMPWIDEVAATIQAWLPGQAFAEALGEVLTGRAEPGGRLPISIPKQEADAPVLFAKPEAGELPYAEGLLVGYRGYDRSGVEPLFPFGHGLGYTTWEYESLRVSSESIAPGQDLELTVALRNSGERAGREVVQVYLESPEEPGRPLRTLAAFGLVEARPGERVEVRLVIPGRAFARYDEVASNWAWRAGEYRLQAGRSSRDLRLQAAVSLSA